MSMAVGSGLNLGYGGTAGDAQGTYHFGQPETTRDVNGGTPPMAGSGNSPGPESPVVMTAMLDTSVGHTLAVDGVTVGSNNDTTAIANDTGNANLTSYLGTNSDLPDVRLLQRRPGRSVGVQPGFERHGGGRGRGLFGLQVAGDRFAGGGARVFDGGRRGRCRATLR